MIDPRLPRQIAGTRLPSGCGFSTVLPDMDFESYSEAGFIWDPIRKNWYAPKGAQKKGIFAVGGAKYTEHPTTEILSLAYDLKDQQGPRLWLPGMPPPADLFDHIADGGLVEAWNCAFEYWLWSNVCVSKMGWPEIPYQQFRDAMAKSRAFAMPGALGKAAEVLGTDNQKQKEGKRLITKFCCPKKPTKKDESTRIRPESDPMDAGNLYAYNLGDIKAEADVSALCPDLPPEELEFELYTRAMNVRGVALDTETIDAGVIILDTALEQYNAELDQITSGVAEKASQVARITTWLNSRGVGGFYSLDAEAVAELLSRPLLPPDCRRALEIRQLVGSAGVKKLFAMQRMVCDSKRAHDLFIYHGARTGRDTGGDIQPQNLVKAGPPLMWCAPCGSPFGQHRNDCPYCGAPVTKETKRAGWSWRAVPYAVEAIRTRELAHVEKLFGDAVLTLGGCIRGMFTADPGNELLASDYSSIEAVVTAVLAGEQWRIDAFDRKEDIYLVSASRITGTPIEEYLAHPDGPKGHPDRQKIGKPAELGLGFGGWLGAWRQFDSTDNFTDEQVIENIKAWRAASPAIVELWGGQVRGLPWRPERKELYGLEGAAIAAIQNPGQCYGYREITYGMKGDALFCRLPSGRLLTYHRPRLAPSTRWDDQLEIWFEGWNSNPKMGPIGWIDIKTYGGRLAENVIQATARDYMRDAVPLLERAGYPIVLRVHDELVAEVPIGFGSIEEFERLMGTTPAWATGWPIRAAGGWRGLRYRKD